jgi:hypothetical protein
VVQIVHLLDKDIGSINWELPSTLAKGMLGLSEHEQVQICEGLGLHLKPYLLTLLSAIQEGGPKCKEALHIINKKNEEALLEIGDLFES